MSLNKSYTLPNTTVATYWKIFSADVNYVTKAAKVAVYGYASKPAREAAPTARVAVKNFIVPVTDTSVDVRPEIYEKLKTLQEKIPGVNRNPFFEGATDC